jgi:hypothetical protein
MGICWIGLSGGLSGKPSSIRFDVRVSCDEDMVPADGQESLLIARPQCINDDPVLFARPREIFRSRNRERAHRVRPLSVQIDCIYQLGVSACSKECLMEADIGPERRPRVSLLNSIVVPLLRFDDPLQIVRTRTTQHFDRSGELKNFADRVDVLYLARCQNAHQRTAIGLALDKPKPVKARQSFTNRVALYAEPVDQRVFDEALARMQEAEDYFLLKLAYQRRDGGFRRPSMRPKKVGGSRHICRGHPAFDAKGCSTVNNIIDKFINYIIWLI